METIQDEKDKMLWRQAKKRVGFKKHFATYIIINAFLWAMWFFTDHKLDDEDTSGIPWPLFCTLGWGIGILFNYMGAYVFVNKHDAVAKEYEKLKNK